MAKKKAPATAKTPEAVLFVLENLNVEEIDAYKGRYQDLYDYFWTEYAFYAQKRSQRIEDIKLALRAVCEQVTFTGFHRVVTLEYSDRLLSSKGSRISVIGGRYNIGNLDPSKFMPFPALYLAESADTARCEWSRMDLSRPKKLTADDFSLSREESNTIIRVHGQLREVIDLTKRESLTAFLQKIKRWAPSDDLIAKAASLGLNPPTAVRNLKQLRELLFAPNWDFFPTFLDIPHGSQVFGMLCKLSGVQGIIYPSKFTGERCLAVFPENINDDSFLQLMDKAPAGVVDVLNIKSWKDLV